MDYYLKKNAFLMNTYEVHNEKCKYLSLLKDAVFLGNFNNRPEAIQEALRLSYLIQHEETCCIGCRE